MLFYRNTENEKKLKHCTNKQAISRFFVMRHNWVLSLRCCGATGIGENFSLKITIAVSDKINFSGQP